MGLLLVIPCGGLGNRLMAMLSARILAEQLGCDFRVAWRGQAWLPLSFYSLRDVLEGVDAWLWEGPDPSPAMPVQHHVPGAAPEVEARLLAGETVVLESYCFIRPSGMDQASFSKAIHDQFARLRPRPEVLARVAAQPTAAIGLQVRRGDCWRSIVYSPLGLFCDVVDRALQAAPDLSIFLATDSVPVQRELRRRYGHRLHHQAWRPEGDPAEGARDALADMVALSRTQRLYTSGQSSFGYIAHLMTRVPYQSVHVPWMPQDWAGPWVIQWHDRYMQWDWSREIWHRRAMEKARGGDVIRAGFMVAVNRVICSPLYQHWPFHRAVLASSGG